MYIRVTKVCYSFYIIQIQTLVQNQILKILEVWISMINKWQTIDVK